MRVNSSVSDSVRILYHPAQGRYLNMAIDEALLRQVQVPVLRFYKWSEPDAISIGYFQAREEVPDQRPFVRRYTGGGLVDHRADLTYSIILPKPHPLVQKGTSVSYEIIHAAVTRALKLQGFDAELAPCCSDVESGACFQKPVKFDIVSGTTKLAGAAQRRTREGCLHQGSVLVENFDFDSLAEGMTRELSPVLGDDFQDSDMSDHEEEQALALEASRYATDEWNLQR